MRWPYAKVHACMLLLQLAHGVRSSSTRLTRSSVAQNGDHASCQRNLYVTCGHSAHTRALIADWSTMQRCAPSRDRIDLPCSEWTGPFLYSPLVVAARAAVSCWGFDGQATLVVTAWPVAARPRSLHVQNPRPRVRLRICSSATVQFVQVARDHLRAFHLRRSRRTRDGTRK